MEERALLVDADATTPTQLVPLDLELLDGEVTIEVEYSGCNFKDAMVTVPGNRVARRHPLIGGVDLAGTVLASDHGGVEVGTPVIVHGYGLGVSHHGGFATLAKVPAPWIVVRPPTLTARQAMAIGTAGFTAFASLDALERAGALPGDGELLVTGATGGVGSFAVAIAAARGFTVVASSGKAGSDAYLAGLGASRTIRRDEIDDRPDRVLGAERWAGAVDCVGGRTLAAILRSLRYGAAVAASGLTAGPGLETTVYPFITRGVQLLGIDAVDLPIADRQATWDAIAASDLGSVVEATAVEVGLAEVPSVLDALLSSRVTGRTVVDVRR